MPGGLSMEEAQRRHAEFGANELARIEREQWWITSAKEFDHFFAVILWAPAALAFLPRWKQPGQGMATLGVAIAGVAARLRSKKCGWKGKYW